MATARDLLLADVLSLFKTPHQDQSKQILVNLLGHFRVQAKQGLDSKGITAREQLVEQLLIIWEKQTPPDYSEDILTVLEGYRMQVRKQGSSKKKLSERDSGTLKSFKKGLLQPLAGGPQKRNRLRGECPKCRSLGVVLARAYSGDEYFSCIYCGFQTYKGGIELDADMPLAAELLSRRFDEKDLPKR